MAEPLCMEHGGETDLGAQVLGVGFHKDREHGVGCRVEQEIVVIMALFW